MIMSGRFHTFLGGLVVRWRGVILGGVRLVVGGGGCGEVFLIRGGEVGGLKKAVNAFLCFSCNPELSTDLDFLDLCCFCFFDF